VKPEDFAAEIAQIVRSVVTPLETRIKELEARELPSPDLGAIAALVDVPTPADGKDGVAPTLDEVLAALKPSVDEALAALPTPQDGRDAPTLEEVLAQIPKPTDGRDAPTLEEILAQVPKPVDGKSVTLDEVRPFMEAELAKWALEFERRSAAVLERAVDRIPRPADAFALEDIELSLGDDGRTVTFGFKRGEAMVTRSVKLPAQIYRGVFSKTASYEPGDCVSWGGSSFICQVATGPANDLVAGESGGPWRLAVKRGRDGNNGRDYRPIDPAPLRVPK
jgi:hypothetical protein